MSYTTATETIRSLQRAGYKTPADVASVIAVADAASDTDATRDAATVALKAALADGDAQAASAAADAIAMAGNPDRFNLYGEIQGIAADVIAERWPAADAWEFAAKRYNAVAQAFTAAVAAVRPDANPATLVKAPEKQRVAWDAIPQLVNDLEAAARLMLGTAMLHTPDVNEHDPLSVMPLWMSCKPGHVRQLVTAMKDRPAPSRAGRWGRYLELGATLGAPTPDLYRPFVL